jgi:hypothetical protein
MSDGELVQVDGYRPLRMVLVAVIVALGLVAPWFVGRIQGLGWGDGVPPYRWAAQFWGLQ